MSGEVTLVTGVGVQQIESAVDNPQPVSPHPGCQFVDRDEQRVAFSVNQ